LSHATTAAFSDAKAMLTAPKSHDTEWGHAPDGP
jgi:hypothetical protein